MTSRSQIRGQTGRPPAKQEGTTRHFGPLSSHALRARRLLALLRLYRGPDPGCALSANSGQGLERSAVRRLGFRL